MIHWPFHKRSWGELLFFSCHTTECVPWTCPACLPVCACVCVWYKLVVSLCTKCHNVITFLRTLHWPPTTLMTFSSVAMFTCTYSPEISLEWKLVIRAIAYTYTYMLIIHCSNFMFTNYILYSPLSCACKHSQQPSQKKCYCLNIREPALLKSNWSFCIVNINSCISFDPPVFLLQAFST